MKVAEVVLKGEDRIEVQVARCLNQVDKLPASAGKVIVLSILVGEQNPEAKA